MNIDHFHSQSRPLETNHEKQTQSLIQWKMRYRNLRRFLENKGVPSEYFDEYNAMLNAEFKYDREARI